MKRITAFALKKGAQLAKAGCEVIEYKSAMVKAARKPVAMTRRAVRKSRFVMEDFLDDVVLTVRRQPLKALGFAFGIGALAGWATRRR